MEEKHERHKKDNQVHSRAGESNDGAQCCGIDCFETAEETAVASLCIAKNLSEANALKDFLQNVPEEKSAGYLFTGRGRYIPLDRLMPLQS